MKVKGCLLEKMESRGGGGKDDLTRCVEEWAHQHPGKAVEQTQRILSFTAKLLLLIGLGLAGVITFIWALIDDPPKAPMDSSVQCSHG